MQSIFTINKFILSVNVLLLPGPVKVLDGYDFLFHILSNNCLTYGLCIFKELFKGDFSFILHTKKHFKGS
jgi:hypothetical protein